MSDSDNGEAANIAKVNMESPREVRESPRHTDSIDNANKYAKNDSFTGESG